MGSTIEKRGQKLVPTTPPPTQNKDSGSPPAPQKQQGHVGRIHYPPKFKEVLRHAYIRPGGSWPETKKIIHIQGRSGEGLDVWYHEAEIDIPSTPPLDLDRGKATGVRAMAFALVENDYGTPTVDRDASSVLDTFHRALEYLDGDPSKPWPDE